MKNNLENKAMFFAQYWNYEYVGSDKYSHIMPDTWSDFPKWIEDQYLILKPLSSISDEDALDIAMIMYGHLEPDLYHYPNMGRFFLDNFSNKNSVYYPILSTQAVDYLRSKGYALPYMGLSVDQLVEYGWIKLKR